MHKASGWSNRFEKNTFENNMLFTKIVIFAVFHNNAKSLSVKSIA